MVKTEKIVSSDWKNNGTFVYVYFKDVKTVSVKDSEGVELEAPKSFKAYQKRWVPLEDFKKLIGVK